MTLGTVVGPPAESPTWHRSDYEIHEEGVYAGIKDEDSVLPEWLVPVSWDGSTRYNGWDDDGPCDPIDLKKISPLEELAEAAK